MAEPSSGPLRKADEASRRAHFGEMVIERMPLAYLHLDADFRIVDWNPAAEKIFGYTREEILGHGPPHEKLVPAASQEQVGEVLARARAGEVSHYAINDNLTRDGRLITCEWLYTALFDDQGRFQGMLCLGQDISARRNLEEQLRHSQKMEAVGHLAGELAHDLNNLLTIIICYSDLLLSAPMPDEATRGLLREIRKAGESSAALTRQLLTFISGCSEDPTLRPDGSAGETHIHQKPLTPAALAGKVRDVLGE